MRESTDLKISKYGHFSCSVPLKTYFWFLSLTTHKIQDFHQLVGYERSAVGYAWNINGNHGTKNWSFLLRISLVNLKKMQENAYLFRFAREIENVFFCAVNMLTRKNSAFLEILGACLGPCQISSMKLFVRLVDIFCKKLRHKYLTRSWIRLRKSWRSSLIAHNSKEYKNVKNKTKT